MAGARSERPTVVPVTGGKLNAPIVDLHAGFVLTLATARQQTISARE